MDNCVQSVQTSFMWKTYRWPYNATGATNLCIDVLWP